MLNKVESKTSRVFLAENTKPHPPTPVPEATRGPRGADEESWCCLP